MVIVAVKNALAVTNNARSARSNVWQRVWAEDKQ
jgi:hypothetical protein